MIEPYTSWLRPQSHVHGLCLWLVMKGSRHVHRMLILPSNGLAVAGEPGTVSRPGNQSGQLPSAGNTGRGQGSADHNGRCIELEAQVSSPFSPRLA